MNAETRAKEAVRDLLAMVSVNGSALGAAQDLADHAITQALRQSQNDKLEEAAVMCKETADGFARAAKRQEKKKRRVEFEILCGFAIETEDFLRSLKSKDTP